ncbi:disulfide bond formation protein DsbA [Opitutaceae bacterium EW11]|nr:disulfide bond formation protein DsbA [Opitutaceae bacterium EW11]
MKVTYFVEIFSSWCHWAEPAWAALKQQYAGKVEFEWKIALMRPDDFPASSADCDWFYRRSGTVMRSPYMLSSGWVEPSRSGHYESANRVAEAGKDFGVTDDRIRLALSQAAMREGRRVADLSLAVEVASRAANLDPGKLRAVAESAEVAKRVDVSTAEFFSYQINQRPAFVLQDRIGDKAVFSGLVRFEPLATTIEAMLADTTAYASYEAHFGRPPTA